MHIVHKQLGTHTVEDMKRTRNVHDTPTEFLAEYTSRRIKEVRKRRKITAEWPQPKELLGCHYPEYLAHLGGVLPLNHEIDHIIALRHYDFDNPIDVMRAFNYIG